MAKLNAMLDELRRGKDVQNRQLATWQAEEEYQSFESDWESQQQIREELNDSILITNTYPSWNNCSALCCSGSFI